MTGDPVCGHRRVHIHKDIVLDDPEGCMALRLDRVVPDILEDVTGDLEPEICPVPALGIFATTRADGGANPIIGVIDIIIRKFDVAQYVSRAEQRAVQRAPEVMMRDAPWDIGIDARRAIPVVADVAGLRALAIAGRALLPKISCDLE
jgi:hypothetical protein